MVSQGPISSCSIIGVSVMTTDVDVLAGVGSGVMIGDSETQELTMIEGRDIVARMMVALVDR